MTIITWYDPLTMQEENTYHIDSYDDKNTFTAYHGSLALAEALKVKQILFIGNIQDSITQPISIKNSKFYQLNDLVLNMDHSFSLYYLLVHQAAIEELHHYLPSIKEYISQQKNIIFYLDAIDALPLLLTLAISLKKLFDIQSIDIYLQDKQLQQRLLKKENSWLNYIENIYSFSYFSQNLNFNHLIPLFPIEEQSKLQQAEFYKNTFNIKLFNKILSHINIKNIPSLFNNIFQFIIQKTSATTLYQQQKNYAYFYLENKDYLRATIFALEAFLTYFQLNETRDYEKRYKIKKKLGSLKQDKLTQEYYDILKDLRNTLAHGSTARKSLIRTLLNDEELLITTLTKILNYLLP